MHANIPNLKLPVLKSLSLSSHRISQNCEDEKTILLQDKSLTHNDSIYQSQTHDAF